MGEVVSFRRKRLTGFLPDEMTDEYRASIKALLPPDEQRDTSPSEVNPDSGDCA